MIRVCQRQRRHLWETLKRVIVSPAVYQRFLEIAELARSLCHSWATCCRCCSFNNIFCFWSSKCRVSCLYTTVIECTLVYRLSLSLRISRLNHVTVLHYYSQDAYRSTDYQVDCAYKCYLPLTCMERITFSSASLNQQWWAKLIHCINLLATLVLWQFTFSINDFIVLNNNVKHIGLLLLLLY